MVYRAVNRNKSHHTPTKNNAVPEQILVTEKNVVTEIYCLIELLLTKKYVVTVNRNMLPLLTTKYVVTVNRNMLLLLTLKYVVTVNKEIHCHCKHRDMLSLLVQKYIL